MSKRSVTYAQAGVDIGKAEQAKNRIGQLAKGTYDRNVLGGIGGFGALYAIDQKRWKEPVLVSSTDGVGTKLKVAIAMKSHSSAAGDLVNHCVNDIAVQGATPLFFLDYFACGRLQGGIIEEVVSGLAAACAANQCSLIGGETAEMPGFYADGEYDLAGFIVGVVERKKLINGSRICPGDVVLGLPSTGLHTNGYSLARKLFFDVAQYTVKTRVKELGSSVGEALLQPHRSYLPPIAKLRDAGVLKGAAHITGGGIPGNLPRILPKGLEARIRVGSWPELPIFQLLQKIGDIPESEMWSAFNRGIGMTLVVSPDDLAKTTAILKKLNEPFYRIGVIAQGRNGVLLEEPAPPNATSVKPTPVRSKKRK
jgi:phosphoribosylformylglycinamidine cyclo-ligase